MYKSLVKYDKLLEQNAGTSLRKETVALTVRTFSFAYDVADQMALSLKIKIR